MSINTTKLLSGKAPVVPYANLDSTRYQFLALGQAEPNLGPGADDSILTISTDNTRVWANSVSLSSVSVSGNITANGLISGNVISASGNIFGGGIRSTTSSTPPSNPSVGDFWYDSTTNAQYRYTFDGTDYFWLDDYGSTVGIDGSFNAVTNGNSNIVITNTNSNATVNINGTSNVAVFANTGFYTTALNLTTSFTPASSSADGVAGQITWDSDYVYVCVATNTWKRSLINTW